MDNWGSGRGQFPYFSAQAREATHWQHTLLHHHNIGRHVQIIIAHACAAWKIRTVMYICWISDVYTTNAKFQESLQTISALALKHVHSADDAQ